MAIFRLLDFFVPRTSWSCATLYYWNNIFSLQSKDAEPVDFSWILSYMNLISVNRSETRSKYDLTVLKAIKRAPPAKCRGAEYRGGGAYQLAGR